MEVNHELDAWQDALRRGPESAPWARSPRRAAPSSAGRGSEPSRAVPTVPTVPTGWTQPVRPASRRAWRPASHRSSRPVRSSWLLSSSPSWLRRASPEGSHGSCGPRAVRWSRMPTARTLPAP
nr:hypothetical protein [Ornithinicoccus soli]